MTYSFDAEPVLGFHRFAIGISCALGDVGGIPAAMAATAFVIIGLGAIQVIPAWRPCRE